MSGSFYGYVLLAAFCTMMLSNDFRRRIFSKETIVYTIKNQSKYRVIYFLMGMTIPVIIFLSAIYLKIDLFTRILMIVISIEMSIIWAIIELLDVIVTTSHIGKVWYTAFDQMEYYSYEFVGKEVALVYKRGNKKRREMISISQEDVEPIKNIMAEHKVKLISGRRNA